MSIQTKATSMFLTLTSRDVAKSVFDDFNPLRWVRALKAQIVGPNAASHEELAALATMKDSVTVAPKEGLERADTRKALEHPINRWLDAINLTGQKIWHDLKMFFDNLINGGEKTATQAVAKTGTKVPGLKAKEELFESILKMEAGETTTKEGLRTTKVVVKDLPNGRKLYEQTLHNSDGTIDVVKEYRVWRDKDGMLNAEVHKTEADSWTSGLAKEKYTERLGRLEDGSDYHLKTFEDGRKVEVTKKIRDDGKLREVETQTSVDGKATSIERIGDPKDPSVFTRTTTRPDGTVEHFESKRIKNANQEDEVLETSSITDSQGKTVTVENAASKDP